MREVTVTGHGQAAATPDVLLATVGVSFSAPHVSAAMSEANGKAHAVIDAVIGAGVAREDVRTAELSVHPNYFHPNDGPARITGYTADNSVRITVRDLTTASDVLDRAVRVGGDAARLSNVNFDLADHGGALRTARERAFEDAQSRAGQYADLAQATLGRVLRIDETGGGAGPHPRQEFALRAAAAPAIAPGQQILSAEVTVVWELL